MATKTLPATGWYLNLTRKERERAAQIIRELANLSHDGWKYARPCDYLPLEAELQALQAKGKGID